MPEIKDLVTTPNYRKSATPGVPPSTAAQKRLEALRVCPLGRLVMQIGEIDLEIQEIKQSAKPSRMVIATLMGVKFNILKTLLPYAYATVPAENPQQKESRVPIVITLDAESIMHEEEELLNNINDTLDEVRQSFPEYAANVSHDPKKIDWDALR
jgi:hypothetical protein